MVRELSKAELTSAIALAAEIEYWCVRVSALAQMRCNTASSNSLSIMLSEAVYELQQCCMGFE